MTPAESLNQALAGEYAAVYAYGVVGARLEGQPDERSAQRAYDAHRMRRSTLTGLVQAAGASPVAAAAAYDLGGPVLTARAARALAALVETRAATTYAAVVAATSGATRQAAATWLTDSAVRVTGWSGRPPTFPGIPERDG